MSAATTGFRDRGIKGWVWTADQYLETIPFLAANGATFLMNCYGSLADTEHYRWGDPRANRWWEPLPPDRRHGLERVVEATQRAGLEFWFSINPNLFAPRPARPDRPADVDALWAHFAWMQDLGVRTFDIALDDVGQGTDPVEQGRLVNAILERLRIIDSGARMVFCPTIFWGAGKAPDQRAYLAGLDATLEPDVDLFWTGDDVVPARISVAAAQAFRAAVGGRRLVIWDNYPCNDAAPTMHLGPLVGREPGLADVAVGYMSNPMASQHRLSRLAISTALEFAADPGAYDAGGAIERAIDRLAADPDEQALLRSLVDAYPGSIAVAGNQYVNPLRTSLDRGDADPGDVEALVEAARRCGFGARYPAELATLAADLDHARAVAHGRGYR